MHLHLSVLVPLSDVFQEGRRLLLRCTFGGLRRVSSLALKLSFSGLEENKALAFGCSIPFLFLRLLSWRVCPSQPLYVRSHVSGRLENELPQYRHCCRNIGSGTPSDGFQSRLSICCNSCAIHRPKKSFGVPFIILTRWVSETQRIAALLKYALIAAIGGISHGHSTRQGGIPVAGRTCSR